MVGRDRSRSRDGRDRRRRSRSASKGSQRRRGEARGSSRRSRSRGREGRSRHSNSRSYRSRSPRSSHHRRSSRSPHSRSCKRSRSRSRDRSRDRRRESTGRPQPAASAGTSIEPVTTSTSGTARGGSPPPDFTFTAAQVAERVTEVCCAPKFSARSLAECFAPDAAVHHLLAANQELCSGADAIVAAFARAAAAAADPRSPQQAVRKRLFLESSEPSDPSFAVDFLAPGLSPWPGAAAAAETSSDAAAASDSAAEHSGGGGGDGDVIMYMVLSSRVRALWACADTDGVGAARGLRKREACAGGAGAAALGLAQARVRGDALRVHYHDYADIPVIG